MEGVLQRYGYSRQVDEDEEAFEKVLLPGLSGLQESLPDVDDSTSLPVVTQSEPRHIEPVAEAMHVPLVDEERNASQAASTQVPSSPVASPLKLSHIKSRPASLPDVRNDTVGCDAGGGEAEPLPAARRRRRGGIRHFLKDLACWP